MNDWRARMDESAEQHAPSWRWRTPGEILRENADNPREWLVPDLLPFGALVLLMGLAKRAGKSTLAWILAAQGECGGECLGGPLPVTRAVIATEEADPDLVRKIQDLRLEASGVRVVSRSTLRGVPDLVRLLEDAMQQAKETGARLLVIDTFSFWAALEDGRENDAGAVTAALRPIQAAVDAGLLVLLIHHPSKAEGREGGVAARGSSALAGAVEATLEIRPLSDDPKDRRRRILAETRFAGVRDLVVELTSPTDDTPTYLLLGDAADVERHETDRKVLGFLSGAGKGAWHTGAEVRDAIPGKGGDVDKALARLRRGRRVAWTGKGRKGNPYRYAALGTPPEHPEDAADEDPEPAAITPDSTADDSPPFSSLSPPGGAGRAIGFSSLPLYRGEGRTNLAPAGKPTASAFSSREENPKVERQDDAPTRGARCADDDLTPTTEDSSLPPGPDAPAWRRSLCPICGVTDRLVGSEAGCATCREFVAAVAS